MAAFVAWRLRLSDSDGLGTAFRGRAVTRVDQDGGVRARNRAARHRSRPNQLAEARVRSDDGREYLLEPVRAADRGETLFPWEMTAARHCSPGNALVGVNAAAASTREHRKHDRVRRVLTDRQSRNSRKSAGAQRSDTGSLVATPSRHSVAFARRPLEPRSTRPLRAE